MTQVSIYDMQLPTKYQLLSYLIRKKDFIRKYFHTISLFICVRDLMHCLFIWNVYCIFCNIRYHTWYNELCSKKSICFNTFLLFAYLNVCFNTKLHKNIPNVDFMAILMKFATCYVRNAIKRPLRPNAPTARVLTSVILKGIGWAFRILYPLKIPGMVHQGLLAPHRLISVMFQVYGCNSYHRIIGPENAYLRPSCHFFACFHVCLCFKN